MSKIVRTRVDKHSKELRDRLRQAARFHRNRNRSLIHLGSRGPISHLSDSFLTSLVNNSNTITKLGHRGSAGSILMFYSSWQRFQRYRDQPLKNRINTKVTRSLP